MNSVRNNVKMVGLGIAVVALMAGCATAKKGAPAAAAAAPASGSYTVVRGDCLWCISGKSEVYGNPYHWPLLYKANSSQIKDADLIFPGQVLTVARNASAGDFAASEKHARNRGAWAVGPVEESDKAYLANN